ncbi:hypothetical protein LCGC14_1207710 [marine sediment metagenome]|uniref:Toprim domain-containing protein n=1 Tax=marine sediment metagenome TaxID=412755 RepID=A0A0F9LEY4_9ZZZZ
MTDILNLNYAGDSPKPDCCMAYCSSCADKSGHVEVNTLKRVYYCFKCGVGGHLDSGDPLRIKRRAKEIPPRVHWEMEETWVGGMAEDYLKGRGFNEYLIKELDPHHGPIPHYIYFPVPNTKNYVDFWTARLWWKSNHSRTDAKKWLFPPGSPGASYRLWGVHRIPQDSDDVVLVEGIFDAVWAYNRLAIFGSSISTVQVNLIRSIHPKTIYIVLDSDAKDKVGGMVKKILNGYTCNLKVVIPPDGKDICDLRWDGTEYIMDKAEDW